MLNKAIELLHAAKKKGVSVTLKEGQLQVSVPENVEIDQQLLELIRTNKALLVDYLNDDRLKLKNIGSEAYKIRPYKRHNLNGVPLSYAQERLWFIDRLQGSQAYHMPFVFRLEGDLSLPVLISSLRSILNRHEVLRT